MALLYPFNTLITLSHQSNITSNQSSQHMHQSITNQVNQFYSKSSNSNKQNIKHISQQKKYCSISNYKGINTYYELILKLTVILSLLTTINNYPTGYILSKNPNIRIEKQSFLNPPIKQAQTFPQKSVSGFKISEQQKLKPLICISALQSYNYQQVNNVISFAIDVKITDNGIQTGDSKYTVGIRDIKQLQGINKLNIQIVFFSQQLNQIVNGLQPLFYSFYYVMNNVKLFGTTNSGKDYLTIDLPVIFNDVNFQLSDSTTNNYNNVWYLKGIDLNGATTLAQLGINFAVNIINTKKIQITVTINHSPYISSPPVQIRLIELSILIYHPKYIQKTQYYIEQTTSTLTKPLGDTNLIISWQYSSSTPAGLNLTNGQFIVGLQTFILTQSITKTLNFQLTSNIASSNSSQIDIQLNTINTAKIEYFQGHFIFFAWAQCPAGTQYSSTNPKCQSLTTCQPNFYLSTLTDTQYNQQYCSPCYTTCQIESGSSSPTCQDTLSNSFSCVQQQCNSNQVRYPNINNFPNQICQDCSSRFGINCLKCTYQQCTSNSCPQNTQFYINSCIISVVCGDKLWKKDQGQQCDNQINQLLLGCVNQNNICKKTDGYTCQNDNNLYPSQPSRCYFTKQLSLKFNQMIKQQFSNKLYIYYKLTSTYWNDFIKLYETVDISSPDFLIQKLSSVSMSYNPSSQDLIFEITYDQHSIQNLTFNVEVNYDQLGKQVLKYQQNLFQSVKIEPKQLVDAYFLHNHETQIYSIAKILLIFYKLAGIIGIFYIIAGFFGGKYIVLEVLAVLQMTYLGLLQFDRYTPFYLSINRLSIIAGNFFQSKSQQPYMKQLNTLGLDSDFYSNFNVQILFFVLFILIGTFLYVYSKVKRSEKSILMYIIGMTFLCQYSFYGLLIFSYLASVSIGLQIKFQLIEKYQQHTNYASLILGFMYVVVMAVYLVLYMRKRKFFGEFFKQMVKFSINELFICLIVIQKLIIGFFLGLLSSFKYIGFALALTECILLIYVILKRPFYNYLHNIRLIVNYVCVIMILIMYNIQKIYFDNFLLIDSSPWCYAWPVLILVLIYVVLIKNAFCMVKQIRICLYRLTTIKQIYEEYTKYCNEKQEAKQQDIDEALKNIYAMNMPDKVQLTEKQIDIWKNFEVIQKPDLVKVDTNKQEDKQNEQLLYPDFRAKLQIKRLDRNIRNIRNKLKKQINKQNKQKESDEEILEQSQQNHNDNKQKSLIEQIEECSQSDNKNSDRFLFSKKIFDTLKEKKVSNNQHPVPLVKIQSRINNKEAILKKQKQQVFSSIFQQDSKRKKLPQEQEYKNRSKMSVYDHWNQIDKIFEKYQNVDDYDQQQGDEFKQKYQQLEYTKNDKNEVKLWNGKTIALKSMKILQKNPILTYYRNEIQTEIHSKVNPFQELKLQTQLRQKKQIEKLQQNEINEKGKKYEQRIKMQQNNKNKSKKKLNYRGGQKYNKLEKQLNKN